MPLHGKLIATRMLPLADSGGLVFLAEISTGGMFSFVGVGSGRPELSTYDPLNWREVQRIQRGIEAGQIPVLKTKFPYWEALPPVPGTDDYARDIEEHGTLAGYDPNR